MYYIKKVSKAPDQVGITSAESTVSTSFVMISTRQDEVYMCGMTLVVCAGLHHA